MRRLSLIPALLLLSALLFTLGGQTTQAQQNAQWKLEFFSNPYLTGDVVLEQRTQSLGIDWGAGSPGTGVPSDNFSARISTDIFLTAGTYRFYMLADDGAHLYVDFQSYINTFEDPRPGEVLTADVTVPTGVTHIQIDYREFDYNAYIYVDWRNLADNPTGPTFPVPTRQPVATTGWTAEYYTNNNLFGSPTAILTETIPRYDWGTGSPLPTMPADNFSARWSSVQFLEAGTYEFNARADDGIRVTIDGIRYVDAWGPATNQSYARQLTLLQGSHNFIIEYYEAQGVAFVDFSLDRINTSTDPVTPAPTTGAYLIVDTGRLNVRDQPNPITGNQLTRISDGENYTIVGRNADTTWWQINVNGLIGWVSANYVDAFNVQNVPITDGTAVTSPPPSTGVSVTAVANLNIRAAPGIRNALIGRIPGTSSASALGRNQNASWVQVNYNGIVGWVSSAYVRFPSGTSISNLPITG
ncbi:MAG: PA14 domain-containing protein [Aggregatilineales bacterium]